MEVKAIGGILYYYCEPIFIYLNFKVKIIFQFKDNLNSLFPNKHK